MKDNDIVNKIQRLVKENLELRIENLELKEKLAIIHKELSSLNNAPLKQKERTPIEKKVFTQSRKGVHFSRDSKYDAEGLGLSEDVIEKLKNRLYQYNLKNKTSTSLKDYVAGIRSGEIKIVSPLPGVANPPSLPPHPPTEHDKDLQKAEELEARKQSEIGNWKEFNKVRLRTGHPPIPFDKWQRLEEQKKEFQKGKAS